MVTVDSTRTSMLPTPSTDRSRASTQSPGAMRTRPHQMNAGGLLLKHCVPRIDNQVPFNEVRNLPPWRSETVRIGSERLMALLTYPATGAGRSLRSSVGGGSTALALTSRISSATRRLNRTLLNEATVPALPMIATIAHERSQSTVFRVRRPALQRGR